MKIAVFSMGPLFPHFVHGGSQKTLETVLLHLGHLGHMCTVYCTQRNDNFEPFNLAPNVRVLPILRFKQTYPETYYTAPYNLADVITTLAQAVESHDVFYIHDSELAFHFLYEHIPTVVSFQDFVYPDTLSNAFSFKRDRLILSSDYVRRCVESIFVSFRDIRQKIAVVPNGFNTTVFQRRDARVLRDTLGLAADAIPLLYPHRPDPKKGIYEAMDTIAVLRKYVPQSMFRRLKLLVPVWMDSNVVQEGTYVFQNMYKDIVDYAQQLDIAHVLHIHPWVAVQDMPNYYSLGMATLCVGNFVEAFGNVSVESELCGTPSIISRVGAQRYVLPEDISYKVDYRNIEGAAQLLSTIICEGKQHTLDVRDYVEMHYNEQQMVNGYAEQIVHAAHSDPVSQIYTYNWHTEDRIEIPVWCALTESGYYNDYFYDYCHDQSLLTIVDHVKQPVTVGKLLQSGVQEDVLHKWTRNGFLTRRPYHIS